MKRVFAFLLVCLMLNGACVATAESVSIIPGHSLTIDVCYMDDNEVMRPLSTMTILVTETVRPGTYVIKVYDSQSANQSLEQIVVSVTRLPGDANMDGIVDLYDAELIAKYIAGWEGLTINLSNADVNQDRQIETRDALLILQYDAGWDVELK